MRLNLTIARNRLEPINVLWTTSDAKTPANTVSRLLADVNERFPLEADDWGLEDYVVSVNGFECLHYANVGETLREGDHVRYTLPFQGCAFTVLIRFGSQYQSARIDRYSFSYTIRQTADLRRRHQSH